MAQLYTGLGAAMQRALEDAKKPENAAKSQAAQTANLAKQAAGEKALADAAKTRTANDEAVQAFVPEIPEDYWGISDASRSWENPFFDESIDPTVYRRFDASEPGSGIATSGNLAASFDQAFLAGLGLVNPIDLGETGRTGDLLADRGTGGFGGAVADAETVDLEITPEMQRAIDLNKTHANAAKMYDTFLNDDYYKDAFEQLGFDPASIKSREDLDAIDPNMKGALYDVVQRTKQMQNQIPKSGILDSLPGKAALFLAGMINPYAAVGLGALAGGTSGEGGVFNALKGAATGYGIGSIPGQGLSIPFTDIGTGPLVYNGVPTGVNPLDFVDGMKGTVAPNAGGATPIGSVGSIYTPGGNQNFVFEPPGGAGTGGNIYGGGGATVDTPLPEGWEDRPFEIDLSGGYPDAPTTQAPAGPSDVSPATGGGTGNYNLYDAASDAVSIADKIAPGGAGQGEIEPSATQGGVLTNESEPAIYTPQSKPVLPDETTPAGTDTALDATGGAGGTGGGGAGPGTGPGEQNQPPDGSLPDVPTMPTIYAGGGGGGGGTPLISDGGTQGAALPQTIYPGFFGEGNLPFEAKPGYRHGTRPGESANVLRPLPPVQVYYRG